MTTAELVVANGKQKGQRIALPKGKFLIGREEDCHLRPNTDMVSRHHCVFISDGITVRLRDLGSTNGTFIDEERLTGARVLESGMKVEFGGLSFTVEVNESAESAPPTPDDIEPVVVSPQDTPAAPVGAESDTMISAGETMVDMPMMPPVEGDTQFGPPPPYPQQPVAYPPQYPQQYPGYPPQGYPQQYPGYLPQGYPQQAYPQQYPGYPQPPGYHPQDYGAPEAAPIEEAVEVADEPAAEKSAPAFSLPDPSQTGAKEPEKKPEEKKKSGAGQGGGDVKDAATDIIKKYLGR